MVAWLSDLLSPLPGRFVPFFTYSVCGCCNSSAQTSSFYTMLTSFLTVAAFATVLLAHGDHEQTPIAGPHKSLWYNTIPGDGGTQVGYAVVSIGLVADSGCRQIRSSRAYRLSAVCRTSRVLPVTTRNMTSPSSVRKTIRSPLLNCIKSTF